MTRTIVLPAACAALPLSLLLLSPREASPQQPERTCDPHELDVRINPNGNVATPADADGQVGCPFVIKVQNQSTATLQVSMKVERTTPGGQRQAFDLCDGRQLTEPQPSPPGSSQITCSVRPNLFAGLGNTTHPSDRNDNAGQPLERGFKYTLTVGAQTIDPTLVIKR